MKGYKISILIWLAGMISMLLIAINFPEWLEWDNFLAGLVYSLILGVMSIFFGIASD